MLKNTLDKLTRHGIGPRSIKTGIAVMITLFVADRFQLTNPFFAAIAAVFAMESTMTATFSVIRDRLLGTVLGALIALIFSLLLPMNPVTIGLGIVIVIYVCNLFKWQGTIKIAIIVFLAIGLGTSSGNQVSYAFYRTLDTFIGLIISGLINYFVFPMDKVNTKE